jgi:xanthine dehydrogenase molybdopterin-binding subunit B
VAFLERATEPGVILGSKAVGEPPLMLAISAREAIRDAIAAFGSGRVVTLDSPATPERIFWAVQQRRTDDRFLSSVTGPHGTAAPALQAAGHSHDD